MPELLWGADLAAKVCFLRGAHTQTFERVGWWWWWCWWWLWWCWWWWWWLWWCWWWWWWLWWVGSQIRVCFLRGAHTQTFERVEWWWWWWWWWLWWWWWWWWWGERTSTHSDIWNDGMIMMITNLPTFYNDNDGKYKDDLKLQFANFSDVSLS